MRGFLRIQTSKFPVLAGEHEALFNPGTYGKAFAEYLQMQLNQAGYSSPFVCCEDWGWWVEVRLPNMPIGLCCYRHHDQNTQCDFVCSLSVNSDRVWSWRRFRMIGIGKELDQLVTDLEKIFSDDPDINFIGHSSEFPF